MDQICSLINGRDPSALVSIAASFKRFEHVERPCVRGVISILVDFGFCRLRAILAQ